MTEDQLKSMSEQEIRRRFRCAPAYYLQAKLDRKRCLDGGRAPARAATPARDAQSRHESPPASIDTAPARRIPRRAVAVPVSTPPPAPVQSLDLPLPGFEILDAALSESGDLEAIAAQASDAGRTQQAILAAALEDYSNWPFLSEPEPEPPAEAADSDLERKLSLVLAAEPELRQVLEIEPDLEVILHSEPALQQALDSEIGYGAGNVTKAHFGQRPPRAVPVVSVVMDRKRPNMVRVVGRSTRLAG